MLTSKDIRNVKFSKSVGGYKQEEVDILLDKIEVDYDQFERTARELSKKIETLSAEIEQYKASESSIQNVLISAQTLADSIINDAKQKSQEIISGAEEHISDIKMREDDALKQLEASTAAKKDKLQQDYDKTEKLLEGKKAAIERATDDSVARQQRAFNRLKLDIISLKKEVAELYKKHTALFESIPDEVPMSPEEIAKVLESDFNAAPDPASFVEEPSAQEPEAEQETAEETVEKAVEEAVEETAEAAPENESKKSPQLDFGAFKPLVADDEEEDE